MKGKRIIAAALLALGISFPAGAEYVIGPGLAFPVPGKLLTSEEKKEGSLTASYPVSRDPNLLKRARINAVTEVEMNRYARWLEKAGEHAPVTGMFLWNEGSDGAETGYTGLVLLESHYFKGAAHPMTYARGYVFDALGQRVPLADLMPDLTAEQVWELTKTQCAERQIPLFPDASIKKIPSQYYLGKDRHVYLIYPLYEIAPYSSGFITVDLGIPEILK